MLHVDERCCGLKRTEVSDEKQVLRRMTRNLLNCAEQTGFTRG